MIENNNYFNRKTTKASTRCKYPNIVDGGCAPTPSEKLKDMESPSPPPPVEEVDLHRVVSLTWNEKYALGSLLIDKAQNGEQFPPFMLTHEMLFSTPYPKVKELQVENLSDTTIVPPGNKASGRESERRRDSKHHTGLWKAHEVGFLNSLLQRKKTTKNKSPAGKMKDKARRDQLLDDKNAKEIESNHQSTSASLYGSEIDAKTDISLCEERTEGSSLGGDSTFDENTPDHYDAWQVLADEYAEDFGFGYEPVGGNENLALDEERKMFHILGTSSDDLKAQPHVLSPPLMESLLCFVPESLSCENWWLKYSLVRDGASLDTFRHYCRAAQYTLLAIQTTKGDVFGSFTAAPWHTGKHGYFGSGESFVWKMRFNRFDHCCSLYEQAQMETECDVFPYSGLNNCFQLCTQDFLGVGGGEIDHRLPFDDTAAEVIGKQKLLGFAIALHDDLSRGTSSPSSTFCNNRLTSNEDGIFEVSNLEVWTLTPCTTVEDAEKLEMRKHFLREKMHEQSTASISSTSMGSSVPSSPMSSQRLFYRRLGEDDEDVYRRDQWILANIKTGGGKGSSSKMSSPSFLS